MIKRSRSKRFKYEKITDYLLKNIREGNLSVGDKLPSVRSLADEFGCNFMTVVKSFESLDKMGLIEKRKRSGTYLKATAVNLINNAVKQPKPLQPTNKIGMLMIPGDGGLYISRLQKSLHIMCEQMGLELHIRTVSKYGMQNLPKIQGLMSHGCCSVIIPWWPFYQDIGEIHKLISSSMLPIVIPEKIAGLENNYAEDPSKSDKNFISRITRSCNYFKALGYKNIALLGTDSEHKSMQGVLLDYAKFTSQNNYQSHIGILRDQTVEDYCQIMNNWKNLFGDLAVICYYDEIAMRLMTAIHKAGSNIPQDIAILGYNDTYEAKFTAPPLSSIKNPFKSWAEDMILHALSMCGDDSQHKKESYVEKFIIRESCGGRLRAGDKLEAILENI